MTFVKFRYTFPTDSIIGSTRDIHCYISKYIEIIHPIHMVVGFESKDKFGQPTQSHIHIHFQTNADVGSIRTALRRFWEKEGETRQRAALYSLKEEVDVVDIDRFWRYPLKQGDKTLEKFQKYPDGFDASLQRALAVEQYNNLVEVNNKKRDTEIGKESTYSKLKKYLDQVPLSTSREVNARVLDYYEQEEMSMNLKTMTGYTLTYCVQKKLVQKSVLLARMDELLFL